MPKPFQDYALAPDADGDVVVHRADCLDVRVAAAQGVPVVTMFQCQGTLPPDLKKHTCLEDKP